MYSRAAGEPESGGGLRVEEEDCRGGTMRKKQEPPPPFPPSLPPSTEGGKKNNKYSSMVQGESFLCIEGGRGKRRGRLPPRRLIPRAHLVCMVHVGAFLDERVHHRQVAIAGSLDQRRVAILPRAQGKHHGGVRGSAT